MTNVRLSLSSCGGGTTSTFPVYETLTCDTWRILSGRNEEDRLDRYRRWVDRLNFAVEDKNEHLRSLEVWLDRCHRAGHRLTWTWE